MTTQTALTIGRIAQSAGVAIDTIRFYERERLQAIDERVAKLQRARHGLSELVDACPAHGAPEDCPILKALVEPNA
jgi:MerR family copper efflux transcriptional regulator